MEYDYELPPRRRGRPRKDDPPRPPTVRGKVGRPRKDSRDHEEVRLARVELYCPKRTNLGWTDVNGFKLGPCAKLSAFLFAFKHARSHEAKECIFWELVSLLWAKEGDEPLFCKNKWSWWMVHNAIRTQYLSIGGSASSGKSFCMAAWVVVCWLSSPSDTMVLLTSTDLGGSRKRIFGAVLKLLQAIPDAPVKYRESIGSICYFDGVNVSNTSGFQMIASDKGSGKLGKMIGLKSNTVLLVADELTDISPNVQSAAVGNLSKNPNFAMYGLGNPNSRLDPLGVFSEPKAGWDSVNVLTDYEWTTRLNGKYLRINSEDSPNLDTTPNPEYPTGGYYPYFPTPESIENDLANMGSTPEEARKSREWLRFNSAVFFQGGTGDDLIYSESELIRSGALRGDGVLTLTNSVVMAGLDPSFSSLGDKTCLCIVEVGYDLYGQHCCVLKELILIYEDAYNKVDPRSLQIAEKVKTACIKHGVKPENLGVDATGAGAAFCDFLQLQWSPGFLRVNWGGSASDRRIKNDSKVTGKDRYTNKASELFFLGKQYLLSRQLAQIPPLVAFQMTNRRFEMSKGPMGMRLTVEPKKSYRARVGKSPDELDSYLVALETARVRQLFMPLNPVDRSDDGAKNIASWLQNRRSHSSYSDDKMGFVANL